MEYTSCSRDTCPAYGTNYEKLFDKQNANVGPQQTENFYDVKEPDSYNSPTQVQGQQQACPEMLQRVCAPNGSLTVQSQQPQDWRMVGETSQPGRSDGVGVAYPTQPAGSRFPGCDCNRNAISPSLMGLISNIEQPELFREGLKTLLNTTENLMKSLEKAASMGSNQLPAARQLPFGGFPLNVANQLMQTFGCPPPPIYNLNNTQPNQFAQNIPGGIVGLQSNQSSNIPGMVSNTNKMNIELPLCLTMTVEKDEHGMPKVLTESLTVQYKKECNTATEDVKIEKQKDEKEKYKDEKKKDEIEKNDIVPQEIKEIKKEPSEEVATPIEPTEQNVEEDVKRESAGCDIDGKKYTRDPSRGLPKPQQRDINLCVPCPCSECPVYVKEVPEPVCPEGCGCCDCPFVLAEKIKNQQKLIKNCTCAPTNGQATSGVNPCTCQPKFEDCKCIQTAKDYLSKQGSVEKKPEVTSPSLTSNYSKYKKILIVIVALLAVIIVSVLIYIWISRQKDEIPETDTC